MLVLCYCAAPGERVADELSFVCALVFVLLLLLFGSQGNRTTPSYVAFTETERLIGDAAKNQTAINPTNTVFGVMRLIGRKFSDPIVQADMKLWPFKVVRGPADKPLIEVRVCVCVFRRRRGRARTCAVVVLFVWRDVFKRARARRRRRVSCKRVTPRARAPHPAG